MIKSNIQISTRDLRDVQARICIAIQAQVSSYDVQLSQERMRIFHRHRALIFIHVAHLITYFVLYKTIEQHKLAIGPLTTACAMFKANSMGLPCQYHIRQIMENNLPLTVNDFHPVWRIDVFVHGSVAAN